MNALYFRNTVNFLTEEIIRPERCVFRDSYWLKNNRCDLAVKNVHILLSGVELLHTGRPYTFLCAPSQIFVVIALNLHTYNPDL